MIRIASKLRFVRATSQLKVGAVSSFAPALVDKSEGAQRTFATSSTSSAASNVTVDDTLDKLFDNQEATTSAVATVADALPTAVWDPTWYNAADQAVNGINMFREVTGLGYGEAIVGVTLTIRVFLFPLFVKLQKNSARMAHMQPEMKALKAQLDDMGPNVDQATQVKYGLQMRALFKKYGCNPFSSLIPPMVQIPVFMGMFFGLRKMPEYYFADNLSTEGLFWFTDLTANDPLYILPVFSALTMLASVELNKDQMMAQNPQQGAIMVNVFRALSVFMVPAIANFPASLNLYWCCNNTVTALQASLFRTPAVRKALGIWEMPKPVPGMPAADGIVETIQKAVQRKPSEAELMKDHNDAIETKKRAEAMTTSSNTTKAKGRKKFRTKRK